MFIHFKNPSRFLPLRGFRQMVGFVVLALLNCFDTHKDTVLGSWAQVATL